MNLDAEFVNSTVRLEVLQPSGPTCRAHVECVSGTQVRVASDVVLAIDAAVQLETESGIFLAEVAAVERTPAGSLARLDIRHFLSKTNVQQVLSYLRAPASRVSRAGA